MGYHLSDFEEPNLQTGLNNDNKQEIKTVRIVKRESKERQKDKTEKSLHNLDQVLEEELNILSEHELSKKRSHNVQKHLKSTNPFILDYDWNCKKEEVHVNEDTYPVSMLDTTKRNLSHDNELKYSREDAISESASLRHKTESIQSLSKTIGELDYQSEAAKQIITEVSSSTMHSENKTTSFNLQRRHIPKEKRRHNTAPHDVNIDSIELMRRIEYINKNVSNTYQV